MAKGSVLTSMLKRVDVAVFETIKNYLTGRFQGRLYRYGIKEAGVGVTDCKYSRDRLPKNWQSRLQQVKKKIIAGKLHVPFDFPQVRKPGVRSVSPSTPPKKRR
jgi:basic membrane protein A